MKGFTREDPWTALCGLSCGLCPMRLGGHCGGCGFGNQSCAIARCSLEHGGVAYCCQCADYPCARYAEADAYDSFITHRNKRENLAAIQTQGVAACIARQQERAALLETLLENYNDGRRKTLYCLAANLLDLASLREILAQAADWPDLPLPDRAARMAAALHAAAEAQQITLKLRKKPKKTP